MPLTFIAGIYGMKFRKYARIKKSRSTGILWCWESWQAFSLMLYWSVGKRWIRLHPLRLKKLLMLLEDLETDKIFLLLSGSLSAGLYAQTESVAGWLFYLLSLTFGNPPGTCAQQAAKTNTLPIAYGQKYPDDQGRKSSANLNCEQRQQASFFLSEDEERFQLALVPRERKGPPLKKMNHAAAESRHGATQAALSEQGFRKGEGNCGHG